MDTLEQRLNDAQPEQLHRYNNISEELATVKLNDDDKKHILWLCGFDKDTYVKMTNLYKKLLES